MLRSVPSLHPDLQKDLLSLFFPESDHPSELYPPQPAPRDASQPVTRRMSV